MNRVLLAAGAEIKSRNVDGNTPLNWTARNIWYRTTLLQALMDAGADINARNVEDNMPLAVAIRHDNQPANQVLQDNGAGKLPVWRRRPLSYGKTGHQQGPLNRRAPENAQVRKNFTETVCASVHLLEKLLLLTNSSLKRDALPVSTGVPHR